MVNDMERRDLARRTATLYAFRQIEGICGNAVAEKLVYEGILRIDTLPLDKLSRWLGYAQAHAEINGMPVQAMRDYTRRLFHEAYELDGIDIPETIDVGENQ